MKTEISFDELIKQRHVVTEMGDFNTIEPEQQTPEVARYWLDCKLGMLSGGSEHAAEYFMQIPNHLRTYALYDVLVRRYPLNLGLVDHQIERYSSLVMTAMRKDPSQRVLQLVHDEYRTPELIKMLFTESRYSPISRAVIDCDWAMGNMTPELIAFACTQSFEFALKADRSLLTDSALAALAIHQINGYNKIRSERRFDLLVQPLSQGHWPKSNLVTGAMPRPQGLSNGFRHLLSARSEDEEALYMAFMMTYPIEKVLKVLNGPRGTRFLMEMYTPEQLRPHLREASVLVKGRVLESDLGM